ncbi:MAG TPA: PhnD/SsuA/transferrin family substrate-binding protein [Candidatus Binatia bacterium]
MSRSTLLAGAVLAALAHVAPVFAEPIGVLVLKEHGVGSPTLAQPYVDKFVGMAARLNGWDDGARGLYVTTRPAAEAFIQSDKPHYGIFSLAALLALRTKHQLAIIGRVGSRLVGGQQYFVVSKEATDLAGCKGAKLASDHTDDARFVERIVARGAFVLGDFQIVQNQRPLQSTKQLLAGEVRCALIDDAQRSELPHLEGGGDVHVVWESATLPALTLAAFPTASEDERKKFRESLRTVCEGEGKSACAEVGISSLEAASPADYADLVARYGG